MKLATLVHKAHINVQSLDMCTSMISLSKIAYHMWRDHSFSQISKKTTERVGRVEKGVGGYREQSRGVEQNLKKGDRKYMYIYVI